MAIRREKFSSQADPTLLSELRKIADDEGRQLQAVLEEAMRDFIEQRKNGKVRPQVMAHFQASVERNRELYRRLAQ